MQATVTVASFKKALAAASGLDRTTADSCDTKIEVKDDKFIISAWGVYASIGLHAEQVEGEALEDGAIILPGEDVLKCLKAAPGGAKEVVITSDDKGRANLDFGTGKFKFAGISAPRNYPDLGEASVDATWIELPGEELLPSLKAVVAAVSKDDTDQAMQGVSLWIGKRTGKSGDVSILEIAGTDRNRCSVAFVRLPDCNIEGHQVIPPQAVNALSAALKGDSSEVSLFLGKDQVFFKLDNGMIQSSIYSGQFPPYPDYLWPKSEWKYEIDVKELLAANKWAAGLMNKDSNGINYKFAKDSISISLEAQGSETAVEVDAKLLSGEGSGITLRLNHKYVADALRAMGGSQVILEVKDEVSPMVMRNLTGSFRCIVVPIAPIGV